MTKKAAALLLAASLAVSVCATPVFAVGKVESSTENPNLKDTAKVEVKYDVATTYTWTIHDEINFGVSAGVQTQVIREDNRVTVTDNTIPEKSYLKITVEGSGATDPDNGNHKKFTINNGADGTQILGYNVNVDDKDIVPGGVILQMNSGVKSDDSSVKYTLDTTLDDVEIAGEYRGTVTYTAEVVNY